MSCLFNPKVCTSKLSALRGHHYDVALPPRTLPCPLSRITLHSTKQVHTPGSSNRILTQPLWHPPHPLPHGTFGHV